ncbi:uncharacterized protein LOC134225570 [Armigeres subalbatus]|uniref:uncharacterized protein LOC134225570 n=1 Tax=Armigeres subalbatus TaxID=124917 RepID=UPI002ED54C8A
MRYTIFVSLIYVVFYIEKTQTYEVTIESMMPDPSSDPDAVDFGTLRITRAGRNTFTISGTFSILRVMGNEARIRLEVLSKDITGPGYNQRIFRNERVFCEYLDTEDMFIPPLRKVSNFPNRGTCPFPKLDVTIKDFQLDEKMLPRMIPKGSYMLRTQILEENRLIMGISATISVH